MTFKLFKRLNNNLKLLDSDVKTQVQAGVNSVFC